MAYTIDSNLKDMRNKFFQGRKDEANQAGTAQLQQGEDAIQRRFASMGASGSGAQIAAMQKNREAAADTARKALGDVNSQELQVAEGDAGRSFQSNEADVARQFQGGLADKDMAFKQRLADADQGNKLKEIDLAERQFSLDKDTTAFNERMAELGAGANGGLLGDGTIGKAVQTLDQFNNPVRTITKSKELNMIANPMGQLTSSIIPGGGGK